MTKILNELLAANKSYAEKFGTKGDLQAAPIKQFAILTCMDARLDPAKFAGLSEGDAHVIRNAGGRASDDAIRSLLISHKLLGTNEWFVIHHTDCGLEKFSNKDIDEKFFEIIGDITCDINGSIPTTIKSTKLKSPYYTNQNTTIMAVDNLPSALPFETSKYFSNHLLKLLPKVLKSLNQDTIEEYFISKKGYLNYRYLHLLNYLIDS